MDHRNPGNAFRLQRDVWTPDPDGPGPRRARVPVPIDAYVPAPIRGLELSVSSAALRSVSDAEQALTTLQHHAASMGVESLAAQLLRSDRPGSPTTSMRCSASGGRDRGTADRTRRPGS